MGVATGPAWWPLPPCPARAPAQPLGLTMVSTGWGFRTHTAVGFHPCQLGQPPQIRLLSLHAAITLQGAFKGHRGLHGMGTWQLVPDAPVTSQWKWSS